MGDRLTGRVLATAALVAGLAWAGTGVATAAPPAERVASWTGDYALTALRVDEGNVVFVSGFVPAQEGAAPTLDIWVRGFYHCTPDGPLQVAVDSLESATATGTTTLTCMWQPDPEDPQEAPGPETMTGIATADVTWSGTGDVRRIGRNGATDHCVGRTLLRSAIVTGGVTVEIPAVGVDLTATEASDSVVGFDRTVCPPGGL